MTVKFKKSPFGVRVYTKVKDRGADHTFEPVDPAYNLNAHRDQKILLDIFDKLLYNKKLLESDIEVLKVFYKTVNNPDGRASNFESLYDFVGTSIRGKTYQHLVIFKDLRSSLLNGRGGLAHLYYMLLKKKISTVNYLVFINHQREPDTEYETGTQWIKVKDFDLDKDGRRFHVVLEAKAKFPGLETDRFTINIADVHTEIDNNRFLVRINHPLDPSEALTEFELYYVDAAEIND